MNHLPIIFFMFMASLPSGQEREGQRQQGQSDDDIEEVYRTSGQPDHRPSPKDPRRDDRIGARCLDGTYTLTQGSGACSGHGGVEAWLYKGQEQELADGLAYTETWKAQRNQMLQQRKDELLPRQPGKGAPPLPQGPDPPAEVPIPWAENLPSGHLLTIMLFLTIIFLIRMIFNRK